MNRLVIVTMTNELSSGEKKKGLFSRLKEGMQKTRDGITGKIDQLIKYYKTIDDEFYEELEEILISADVGVKTSIRIIEELKKKVREHKMSDTKQIHEILKESIAELLDAEEDVFNFQQPMVFLIVGVNGVGKTTTAGKLAYRMKEEGKQVILAAGDTFRAAASEQLSIWGQRVGVPVIHHEEGADPAAVVFDAIQAAKSRKADVLICDTAGRMHNKKNLMEELKKISRVIEREFPEAKKEVYLVLDATIGQNAIMQSIQFKEAVSIDGIILTKLDGTAKGGVVISIKSELRIPIRFIGVGEQLDDFQVFNARDFADALF